MRTLFAGASLVLALVSPSLAAQAPGTKPLTAEELGPRAKAIAEAHVGLVVTVKVVIKIEFMGRSEERRFESRGALVSGTGLVMADDSIVDPKIDVRSGNQQVKDVTVTPEDIKIVFGNEEEEQDAFLVAKDSKLGFCFLQVRDFDPKARKIEVPDFTKAKDPHVGQIVVSPNRLEKGFDYAPYFLFVWLTGELKQPRKAYLVSSSNSSGLPAYDLAGNLVGAFTNVKPSVGTGNARAVLLKGGVVHGAIGQALQRAGEMLAEEKKGGGKTEPAEKAEPADKKDPEKKDPPEKEGTGVKKDG